jgi:hypothetical protein
MLVYKNILCYGNIESMESNLYHMCEKDALSFSGYLLI